MAYYYRDYGGPAIGPASEAELIKLAKLGVISPTTEVRSGMSPTWFTATKIPGIVFTTQPDDSPKIVSENTIGEIGQVTVDAMSHDTESSENSDSPQTSANAANVSSHHSKRWWNILEIILEIGCVATIAHILYYMQPPANVIATCTHRIPFSPVAVVAVLAAIWGILLCGRLVKIWRR